ncbi:MAG: sensor histidine kinase [Gemmatimonadales bacterium]|nr:MAG: sensor histidine kinase [Gemmatimonadales bacterium]
MRLAKTLRARLFWALLLAAVIPSGLLLLGGSFLVREAVVATGTAGPWGTVAESGRELLSTLEEDPDTDPAVLELAREHRGQLSESVRLSRLYGYLGERALTLLPLVSGLLLLLAAALALLAATLVSRSLAAPVGELVHWTERLGRGTPLPAGGAEDAPHPIREIETLREALRTLESRLTEARRRERRQARLQSWSGMARRMAHELKNPLMPMQMAARTVARSGDPSVAEAGQVLVEEIRRLDDMARTLSHFGRTPDGPPSPVDMEELVQGVVDRMSSGTPGVDLSVTDLEDPMIQGHPVILERVVRNLLANAMEAAQEAGFDPATGPAVEVRLRGATSGVELRILDRGPGLPEGEAERIWEPDFTTKRKGTGLGLPMVRQVVEAHGGVVSAANRAGGGAEFLVRLPRDLQTAREDSGDAGVDSTGGRQ